MTTTSEDAAKAPARKPASRPMFWHTCPECGERFKGRLDAAFCSVDHKNAFHNRSAKRGKVMIPLVLAWRGSKGNAKWAMRQMAALSDQWNREDRLAGRMSMDDYLARKVREGWAPADR